MTTYMTKRPRIVRWAADRFHAFQSREPNYVARQRQTIMICYSTAIIVGTISNILGVLGASHPFFTATNSLLLAIFTFLTVCYLSGKLGLVKVISIMTLSFEIFIAIDTVYSAVHPALPNRLMVILVNMAILSNNIIISLATYLTRVTQLMTGIALATYVACMFITRNSALADYFSILLLVLLLISFLGFHIAKNAKRLEKENYSLRKDETELLHILRLNKKQVKAYIALAQQEHTPEDTGRLLDLLGERSQKNLIANVKEYMLKNETEGCKLEQLLPELTPSEISICQLILRDKKLGEICAILDKSESNINTQRGNIRKKLGLQPADNLQKALQQRIRQA